MGPLRISSKLPVLRRRTDLVGEVIGAFESETAAVILRTAPRSEGTTLYVFLGMLVFAVVFTCVAKVDRVVTSVAGIIIPSAGTLYVSPLNLSLVRSVNVREGQIVKKGQALATLDPTFTQADLVQMQEHMASDEAAVAREQAELAMRPYVFSKTDKYQAVQGDLWTRRQAEYHANVANYDGQISSTEAQMMQAKSDAEKYTVRLQLATDAENVYSPLLDKGYVSKLQLMTATDAKTEMSRLLADAQNEISQYRETIASLRGQRDAYIHTWYADLGTQLTSDQNDLDLTRDSLDKDQKYQDLTSLDAPEDAIVLKVGKMSPGSVAPGNGMDSVTPGTDPLFTLARLDAQVESELDIATTDAGFVAVGDPVQLKFDTYSYIMYGMARGVVTSVSEGSFSVDQNNTPVAPYFKVRVKVTKVELHDVPAGFRVMPGMTLTGDIMIGRRTIMSYLTESLLKQGEETMREPQ